MEKKITCDFEKNSVTGNRRIVFKNGEKELSIHIHNRFNFIDSVGMFETGKEDQFHNGVCPETDFTEFLDFISNK